MATPGSVSQQKYQQELGGNQPVPGYGIMLGSATSVAHVDAYWAPWVQIAVAVDDGYSLSSFRQQWIQQIAAMPDYNANNGLGGFSSQQYFDIYALKSVPVGSLTPFTAPKTLLQPGAVESGAIVLTESEREAYDAAVAAGNVSPTGHIMLDVPLSNYPGKLIYPASAPGVAVPPIGTSSIGGVLPPSPTSSALPAAPTTIGTGHHGATIEVVPNMAVNLTQEPAAPSDIGWKTYALAAVALLVVLYFARD